MEFTSTGTEYVDEFFAHHGIKGQKWGIRRWQNLDGTLTDEGKKRYIKAKERWSDEGIVKRSNKMWLSTLGGGTVYAGSLIGGVIAANPILAGAGAAAGIAAMLAYPLKDVITTSRDNRMATLAKDEALKKKIEDIRSDQTGTRAWEVRRKVRWEKKLKKANEKEQKRKEYEKELEEKSVKHTDSLGITFNDILAVGESIEHSGIKGQKWGLRRFQYNDGSLTPEGRKRYLKGGDRAVRKAEKQREKREAILSDRKKLYKHRNEFTKEEIDKAMARFASQDALRTQMNAEKEAKRRDRAELKRSKIEYKKLKLQQKQMSEQEKQAKLSTEQKKLETEQKKEAADAQAASTRWRERANKAKSVVEFAKVGKEILDDMGITSKEEGESLLGSFATAIGIKDVSAKKAAAELKKKREKAQADWEFNTKKMAYEKAKEEFDDRAAKKQRQEAMDELKRRQEEAKTKTAEYNANNPGKGGKGGGLTISDIEDLLRQYGVIS